MMFFFLLFICVFLTATRRLLAEIKIERVWKQASVAENVLLLFRLNLGVVASELCKWHFSPVDLRVATPQFLSRVYPRSAGLVFEPTLSVQSCEPFHSKYTVFESISYLWQHKVQDARFSSNRQTIQRWPAQTFTRCGKFFTFAKWSFLEMVIS